MEYAKYIFKFNNPMLPDSFDHCFTTISSVHNYYTKQRQRNECFQFGISFEWRRKTPICFCGSGH